ncbi:MAG: uracil phosphoribosyltransferase [Planctomycetes bacterium]|nr:uracil phosphoribosyltransferase [Planctomycetota bacterium]
MNERAHGYGTDIHILDDPFLTSLLARVGHPSTTTPMLRDLLRLVYGRLIGATLAIEFPLHFDSVETRMAKVHEAGTWSGELLDPTTEVVIACIVRAGVLPAEVCYEALSHVIAPDRIRIDYLSMSRRVDDDGKVIGTDDSGLKIGGTIRDKILLVPDPMGATGGTIERVLELYDELDLGPAAKAIALPMIATPEFCKRLSGSRPELVVWTGRLDRGLSSERALAANPGTYPDEESGLTAEHYIVPGAGGIGELLTNSWV